MQASVDKITWKGENWNVFVCIIGIHGITKDMHSTSQHLCVCRNQHGIHLEWPHNNVDDFTTNSRSLRTDQFQFLFIHSFIWCLLFSFVIHSWSALNSCRWNRNMTFDALDFDLNIPALAFDSIPCWFIPDNIQMEWYMFFTFAWICYCFTIPLDGKMSMPSLRAVVESQILIFQWFKVDQSTLPSICCFKHPHEAWFLVWIVHLHHHQASLATLNYVREVGALTVQCAGH